MARNIAELPLRPRYSGLRVARGWELRARSYAVWRGHNVRGVAPLMQLPPLALQERAMRSCGAEGPSPRVCSRSAFAARYGVLQNGCGNPGALVIRAHLTPKHEADWPRPERNAELRRSRRETDTVGGFRSTLTAKWATPSTGRDQGESPFGQGSPFAFYFRQFGRSGPQGAPLQKAHAQGSGFYLAGDEYILTNNPVVDHAKRVQIKTMEGKTFEA